MVKLREHIRLGRRQFLVMALAFIGVYLIGTAVYAGVQLMQARAEIAQLLAERPESAPELVESFESVAGKFERADLALSGPIWSLISATPLIGNNPAVVREITSSSRELFTALSPALAMLEAGSLEIDQDFLDSVELAVNQTDSILRDSLPAIKATPDALLLPQIAGAKTELIAQLNSLQPSLKEVKNLLAVAPILFGTKQEQEWIVIFANGAEARPAGGFPGGWGIIHARNGKLKLTNLESNDRLSASAVLGWETIAGPDAASLYGSDLSRVLDMGLSPDFEISGALFYELYVQQTPGREPIGVLQFDEHALAKLLELTGAVTIPNGKSIDSSNAVDYITRQVYFDYPDVKLKDEVLLGIARDIFKRLNTANGYSLSFITTMLDAITDQRIRAWTNDLGTQKILRQTALGGNLRSLGQFSHAVAVANGGGNKLEAYFNYAVSYRAGKCRPASGYREATLEILISNTAPASGLPDYVTPRTDLGIAQPEPQGGTREIIYVHLPAGSTVKRTLLDGDISQHTRFGTENGRDVYRFDIEVEAQQERTLELRVLEFAQDGDPLREFWLQPLPKPMELIVENSKVACFGWK